MAIAPRNALAFTPSRDAVKTLNAALAAGLTTHHENDDIRRLADEGNSITFNATLSKLAAKLDVIRAAAPEMLAALQVMVERDRTGVCPTPAEFGAACAAIAKATGATP